MEAQTKDPDGVDRGCDVARFGGNRDVGGSCALGRKRKNSDFCGEQERPWLDVYVSIIWVAV